MVATAAKPLKGQAAVVTGSTSGIGLGIAGALAEAGADVMLNGFGDADAIAWIRADLAERHGARVLHSGADMTRPREVAALVAEAAAAVRAPRYPHQQCGHPVRRADRGVSR